MMYDKIKELSERSRNATTKKEKEDIRNAMFLLQEENPQEYGEALERLISETSARLEALTVAEKIGDISKVVSMSYIAKTYFGKTRSWLAHKLNGDVVNGKPAGFSDEELVKLKFAFNDLSKRLGSLSAVL